MTKTLHTLDGRTFTYVRKLYCDGILMQDYWYDPDLFNHPEVTMKFKLHGAGWLRTKIWGSLDGELKGNHNFSTPKKVGWWVAAFVPVRDFVHNKEIKLSFEDNLKKDAKTYQWSANGEVELTPIYWKRKFGLQIGSSAVGVALTGTWEEGKIQTYTKFTLFILKLLPRKWAGTVPAPTI